MDGTIKTVQKEYIEEGGMIFEDMRVDSIPSYLEKHLLEEVLGQFCSKLCNQVRSLDHFVVQNSGDFLC